MLKVFRWLLVASLVVLLAPSARAETEVTCPNGTVVRGICILGAEVPPPTGGGNVPLAAQPRQCFDRGRVVSCFHEEYGSWSAANGCCLSPAPLQPVAGHPVWEARTDGVIYNCVHPSNPGFVTMVWGPGSEMVEPRALAEQLRASMRFDPVSIGIVPEPGPDRLGLVGLPTWMWASNPGPTTLGPQTRSLSAGGVSVTLSAEVVSTRWEMGDGGVVTCRGPGTPYEDRFGAIDSPTCGYRYSEQGTYTVRALTNWSAVWRSNTGEHGVFTWQVVSSTVINMGEAQALNQ